MSDIAICVENLSKRYRIGAKEETQNTFAGAVTSLLCGPFRNFRRLRRMTSFPDGRYNDEDDVFWALRDVSFEVKQGEALGVIGRNGAGKSTLLKILSRITHPTSGRVTLHGRVSSLLEVGTGFHPELTGRENVYLNGTILGMTKTEIDRKFDEIVDFSSIEKFIDTPVKFYSSGMSVRLAFSIAAYLEPEILLVDEVLAVGDIEFQKKCLGKMDEVARGGRTVLFVSHNMGAVASLTNKSLLLNDGMLVNKGSSTDIIRLYYESQKAKALQGTSLLNTDDIELLDFSIKDSRSLQQVEVGQDLQVMITIRVKDTFTKLSIGFDMVNQDGHLIFRSYQDDNSIGDFSYRPGVHELTCAIPPLFINEGTYFFNFRAGIKGVRRLGIVENITSVQVFHNLSYTEPSQYQKLPGILSPTVKWEIVKQ